MMIQQVKQKERKEAAVVAAATPKGKITPGIKRIEGVLLRGDLSLLDAINRGVASVADPQVSYVTPPPSPRRYILYYPHID